MRNNMIIYVSKDGNVKVDVNIQNEDIWMSQDVMANLYDTTKQNISYHLSNIFKEEELDKNSVVKDFLTTASDGKNYNVLHYNLDAIIAVGYRINSKKATEFRIWATKVLKEYMTKGFALNDERLKDNGESPYFEELLARIRDIRSSEKIFWRKVLDIYATSIDYDPKSPISIEFFKKVQNKMHYAVSRKTAAEIIYDRVNSEKEHMGLTSWKNSPNGKIMESDVIIAKNYLSKDELQDLEGIVSAFLEIAENRARRHIPMTMEDWANRIDKFLLADDRDILKDAGKISHEIACDKALTEFEKYRIKQDKLYKSDFDLLMEESEIYLKGDENE